MRKLVALIGVLLVAVLASCTDQPLEPDVSPSLSVPNGPRFKGAADWHPFMDVGAGLQYTCAIFHGRTACWGRNRYGQLGNGTFDASPTPVAVASGRRFAYLYVSDEHVCALDARGAAWCWGSNKMGGLGAGLPEGSNSPVPVPVSGGLRFKTLDVGLRHTCGITLDRKTYCWGHGIWGQLGNGSYQNSTVPVAVNTTLRFESLALAAAASCGLTEFGSGASGSVYCWGGDVYGVFGNGEGFTRKNPSPVLAAGGKQFSRLYGGAGYACGIDPRNRAYCWGHDAYSGRLGLGAKSDFVRVPTPVAVPAVVPREGFLLSHLTLNKSNSVLGHTCGFTRVPASTYCWGNNSREALGASSSETCERSGFGYPCSTTPLRIDELSYPNLRVGTALMAVGASHRAGGEDYPMHSCAMLNRPPWITCWGVNDFGQLGDGTYQDKTRPFQDPQIPLW